MAAGEASSPVDLRQACLRSLAFPEMNSRSEDIDDPARGTCKWLLEHEQYNAWAAGDGGLLWIKGKPGSGKSTVLRNALRNSQSSPHMSKDSLILSFFYHGRGSELQRTPIGLYRSLLCQFKSIDGALSDAIAAFKERYETFGEPGTKWQWHLKELKRFFQSALRTVLQSRPVWLFIDALDESGRDNATDLMNDMKLSMEDLSQLDLHQFHVCFTCRHYPNLPVDLESEYQIYVEMENGPDIETYVRGKLPSSRFRNASTFLDMVTERADGVFLWTLLVVRKILDEESNGATPQEIQNIVLRVPRELNDLYRELIQDMNDPQSLKLIQWVCFAFRPIYSYDLRWVMVLDSDCPYRTLEECPANGFRLDDKGAPNRVRQLSRGLVELTGDKKTAQFIHQTTKDFFVDEGLASLARVLDPAETSAFNSDLEAKAHYRISRSCLQYLAILAFARDSLSIDNGIKADSLFIVYARYGWSYHARLCEQGSRAAHSGDIWKYVGWPSDTTVQLLASQDDPDDRLGPVEQPEALLFHLLCKHQLLASLEEALRQAGSDKMRYILATDKKGQSLLSTAAKQGNEDIVRYLLETEKRSPRPFWLLASRHSSQIDLADADGRTPLCRAAEKKYTAIVRLLVENGADVNHSDKNGRVPLWWACQSGFFFGGDACVADPPGTEAVVRILLDSGAEVRSADRSGAKLAAPLFRAVESDSRAVAQLLLARGAEVDVVDPDSGHTPLTMAATDNNLIMVHLLMRHGARIRNIDPNFESTFRTVVRNCRVDIARILLDNGASLGCTGPFSAALLWCSAEGSNVDMFRFLLGLGLKVDYKHTWENGQTMLHHATGVDPERRVARYGVSDEFHRQKSGRFYHRQAEQQVALVAMLLDGGADIDRRDDTGYSPLSYAAAGGGEAVVNLLIDRGATVDSRNDSGRTALMVAARFNRHQVVDLLLSRGARVDMADRDGYTALGIAAERGHGNLVRDLIGRGARTEALTQNALHLAALYDHTSVVRVLLDEGASVDLASSHGRTPLSWAAEGGSIGAIELLLERGARTDLADDDGRRPVDWAWKADEKEAAEFLSERTPRRRGDSIASLD